MTVFTIDGQEFSEVGVVSITRNFEVKDYANSTGVSINGNTLREVMGTYIGYKIKLDAKALSPQKYDALFEILSESTGFHTFVMPYGQSIITFLAAVYSGSDDLKMMRANQNYWGNLEIDVKSKAPIKYPAPVVLQ